MFEYHGWVTVQSSAGDEDEAAADDAVRRVEGELGALASLPGLVDIRTVNGMTQVQLAGFTNHRGGQGETVVEVFRRIGLVAAGSYGLLYVRDDEDPHGRGNEFQVRVMRRGAISDASDQFLSPCIPEIEDLESPAR
ncbi:Imm7 family immunity protein [Nocardia sp. NBC_00511]|uniref:Imm7 family immunity protein n=1 Tax=Nocardia sp. NBC_00511 TaxID=2903591 RepID=UPI0030DFE357